MWIFAYFIASVTVNTLFRSFYPGVLAVIVLTANLARISHQMDEPSLDLWIHKKFSSVGNTARIPLLRYAFLLRLQVLPEPSLVRAFGAVRLTLQKIPCESKSLRDHLAHW